MTDLGPERPAPKVLIVDDDLTQAEMMHSALELEGFDVACTDSPKKALALFTQQRPEVVLSDLRMPEMSGLELFQKVHPQDPDVIFVIISAFGTLETAVEAMREGVHDFITKPIDLDELTLRLRKALRYRGLVQENQTLRKAVDALRERVRIVGTSAGVTEVLETMERVAPSQATVLVRGESGTGKELVARGIHLASPRHAEAYVRVNCAALPDNLLEDELFGHARGAFTGAVSERMGRFQQAQKGTIFLDEIGDLPLHLQPKLLRVLQEREFEAVGSNRTISLDVRVIAATHQDLAQMVSEGRFREDLYYRLSVIPIELPPLRERQDDIPLLANHFLRHFCEENSKKVSGFSAAAMKKLQTYSWPGNVRELENSVERAVVLATTEILGDSDLLLAGPRRAGVHAQAVDALFDSELTLDELERQIILSGIERCQGNLSQAARRLGLTRRALQYRVEKIRGAKESPDE